MRVVVESAFQHRASGAAPSRRWPLAVIGATGNQRTRPTNPGCGPVPRRSRTASRLRINRAPLDAVCARSLNEVFHVMAPQSAGEHRERKNRTVGTLRVIGDAVRSDDTVLPRGLLKIQAALWEGICFQAALAG